MNEILETPVLIVGAGPVGLSLALDLGWRGVACTIIDQNDMDVVLPRAAAITSRTMEFVRRWGILDDVVSAGFPQDYPLDIVYCTSLSGYLLEREPFPALADRESPSYSPQPRHRCPQRMFDPVLERAARSYPHVSVLRRHRLERFEETTQGVSALVRRLDVGRLHNFSGDDIDSVEIGAVTDQAAEAPGLVRISARYMVACDGIDSGVRNALGIGVEGNPVINYTVSLLVRSPELHKRHKMGAAERYMLVGPEGIWGNLTVVDGRDEWRLSLRGSAQKLDLANLDVDELVRRCLGRSDIPFKVEAVSPWRRREALASSMQCGRVFMAGDAGHAMSPTGGFGNNTGIGDAVDLGWKLQATLCGWAGKGLLNTYQVERKPVGRRFVSAATELFHPWMLDLDYSKVCENSPEGEKSRRHIGATLKRDFYPEWEVTGTSMGYRYDNSPIVVPDGTPAPPDDPVIYVQTARPGSRAPHAWLKDGRSTLDLFGRDFVLLQFGNADVSDLKKAAELRKFPLTIVNIQQSDIADLYERSLVLVRPDGHTAWRADGIPDDPLALIDTVRGDVIQIESSNTPSAESAIHG